MPPRPPADVDSAAFAREIDALLAEDATLAGLAGMSPPGAAGVGPAERGPSHREGPGAAPPNPPPPPAALPRRGGGGRPSYAARHSSVERARRERLNSLIKEVREKGKRGRGARAAG